MSENQGICPLCWKELGSEDEVKISNKGAEGINNASVERGNNIIVTVGTVVHKFCRMNYVHKRNIEVINIEPLPDSNQHFDNHKLRAQGSYLNEQISRLTAVKDNIDLNESPQGIKTNLEKITGKEKKVKTIIKEINLENQYDRLSYVMTKFWKLPYDKQLNVKHKRMSTDLKKIQIKINSYASKYDNNSSWKLQPIIPSQVTDKYRCKDEFSIGYGVDGDPKTIGFFVGSWHEDKPVYCVRPNNLITLKQQHKDVAQAYENFIKSSPLKASYKLNDDGVWRGITVQSNKAKELMVTVVTNPKNLQEDKKIEVTEKLKEYFESLADELSIKSFYHQYSEQTRPTSDHSPLIHLFGLSTLFESINGMKFRITPDAVFHANVDASEVFNKTIKSLCFLKEDSVVLNVNSRVGTLDLYLAKFCKSVTGLTSSTLLNDATLNAELNDINNAKLLSGKVLDVLPEVLQSLSNNDNVLILDLGKAGLASNIIDIVKNSQRLNRVLVTASGLNENVQRNIMRMAYAMKFGKEFIVQSRRNVGRGTGVELSQSMDRKSDTEKIIIEDQELVKLLIELSTSRQVHQL
ncbi:tRNA (uracil(54)-C(5))-methyltransferase [Nymphon striatum]|nr:tRNA (uracil(54)-C(5))-methyltransferase [Nymphon striatum]